MKNAPPASVDEYIAGHPSKLRAILKKIRAAMKKGAPGAEEAIKYGMPTLVWHGNLVSYGVYKTHVGVYPRPKGDTAFRKAMAPYEALKSTYRFPLDEPIPLDLIEQIAKFRAQEASERAAAGGKKK